MRCFLKDADSKQKEDEGVKNWVEQIRDVSYEAEDVIETFIYSQRRRRRRGFVGRVKRYICILSELRARHKVAEQIEKIKLNIGEISRRRETYGITNINEVEASSSSQSSQEYRRIFTAVEDSESEVVGLQDEVNNVKKQLMTGEPRRRVISIFGMGGLEDYEIGSGKLIRLWIAEGFIQQNRNKLMEDVAEDYLEELVSRSMIQIASKKSNGSIHKCRIHDLLRELSISEATENNFFAVLDNDTSSSSTSVRRLAFYDNIDWDETKNNSIETLRSILYFFHSNVDGIKLPNISSKLLRVMNVELEDPSDALISKEVGEFVHLKFLEFSGRSSPERSIPRSIGNLSSLQSLKVRGSLPNTIWNLKELRHLQARSVEGHPHLSNLRNLQTLSLEAGSWIKEGLGKLTNLRKLIISGVDMSSYHDTLPYCIQKLCNLRSLELNDWSDKLIPPFLPFTLHPHLYKILLRGSIKKLPELPPNLVQLTLDHSELKQDAIVTLEKLQHLKILRLIDNSYISKQMICSPGGFPRLEFLQLYDLPLVEEWIVEEGAMKSLKSVQLTLMNELKTETLPERVRALINEGELV